MEYPNLLQLQYARRLGWPFVAGGAVVLRAGGPTTVVLPATLQYNAAVGGNAVVALLQAKRFKRSPRRTSPHAGGYMVTCMNLVAFQIHGRQDTLTPLQALRDDHLQHAAADTILALSDNGIG